MSDDRTRVAGSVPGSDATQAATVFSAPVTPTAPPGNAGSTGFAAPRLPPAPVQLGEILGHTYCIEAFLAKGGMGAVYRARHLVLDSEHAIKIILPELSEDPKVIALMTQEARTLYTVKNDAVVEYQGLMLDEHGRRYLVMEFVDGPSLASVIKERRFSPAEVRLLRQRLAAGLGAAHQKGIYHRDVSPENVILPGASIEKAKIIDFGIAKATASGEKTILGGTFAGKYSYASPEQAGMYGGTVDARSDIYSLGLVLANCAIGLGDKIDMGHSLMSMFEARQKIPKLDLVPPELRSELAAMLQPNPEDRPQTMAAVAALGDTLIQARPATEMAPIIDKATTEAGTPTPPKRSSLGLAAAIFAAFALIGGGAAWFFMTPHAPPQRVEPQGVENQGDADRQAGRDAPKPPEDLPARAVTELSSAFAGFTCAELHAEPGAHGIELRGFVGSSADLDRLRQRAASIAGPTVALDAVKVYPPPQCGLITLLAGQPKAPEPQFVDHPARLYHDGELLILTVTADSDSYLYVDAYDTSGSVTHLLPTALRPENGVKAGQKITLGAPSKPNDRTYTQGEPYGPTLITVLTSPKPLFPHPRAEEAEPTDPYLKEIDTRIKAPGQEVRASYAVFDVAP
jgi:eukaryotic-like serine/threonine-protein kinase